MVSVNEKHFEEKAERILNFLKSNLRYDRKFMPRPFMVEFTGSPSSGKTTTITEMDKFLRRHGFRVWRPQEGAEVIRHIERNTPIYNIRTGLYALTILLDESVANKYDVIIFDRCIFDAYSWMMYWEEKSKLTREEKTLIQAFFTSRLWIDNIDLAYFMVADPEEAMRREQRIALSQKLGETTNPQTIATLINRYKEAFRILSPSYPQLRMMDTSHIPEQKMVEQIAEEVLSTFEKIALQSSV